MTMRTLSPARAIVLGTLAVGVLDALDAVVFFGLRSAVPPIRIFQSIAAGLLGRAAAFQGGLGTAALGVGLHFCIAFAIVATYFVVSRRLRILTDRPVIFGLLYGVAVYFVMNMIVVPLSAAGGSSAAPPWPVLVNGLLIHAVGVGLPSALFARAAAPRSRG
jgi:uncharacterized membrane protein YagU involved in acid resistance